MKPLLLLTKTTAFLLAGALVLPPPAAALRTQSGLENASEESLRNAFTSVLTDETREALLRQTGLEGKGSPARWEAEHLRIQKALRRLPGGQFNRKTLQQMAKMSEGALYAHGYQDLIWGENERRLAEDPGSVLIWTSKLLSDSLDQLIRHHHGGETTVQELARRLKTSHQVLYLLGVTRRVAAENRRRLEAGEGLSIELPAQTKPLQGPSSSAGLEGAMELERMMQAVAYRWRRSGWIQSPSSLASVFSRARGLADQNYLDQFDDEERGRVRRDRLRTMRVAVRVLQALSLPPQETGLRVTGLKSAWGFTRTAVLTLPSDGEEVLGAKIHFRMAADSPLVDILLTRATGPGEPAQTLGGLRMGVDRRLSPGGPLLRLEFAATGQKTWVDRLDLAPVFGTATTNFRELISRFRAFQARLSRFLDLAQAQPPGSPPASAAGLEGTFVDPQMGKDNSFGQGLNHLLLKATDQALANYAVLSRIGPALEEYARWVTRRKGLTLLIVPDGATLKGCAADRDPPEAQFALLRGPGNAAFLSPETSRKIHQELDRLLRKNHYAGNGAVRPKQIPHFSQAHLNSIFRKTKLDADPNPLFIRYLFRPTVYAGDPGLLEECRSRVIRALANRPSEKSDLFWSEIQTQYAEEALKISLREMDHFEDAVAPVPLAEDAPLLSPEETLRYFNERRREWLGLPAFQEMVKIYRPNPDERRVPYLRERCRPFLRKLFPPGSAKPAPVLITRGLEERFLKPGRLAAVLGEHGLHSQGERSAVEVMADLLIEDPDSFQALTVVGLPEEMPAFREVAQRTEVHLTEITPKKPGFRTVVLAILSALSNLKEEAVQHRQGFQGFMTALRQLAKGA